MPHSPIGLSKWDLDTPALLLDLDRLESNIKRIADRCHTAGLQWRPHTKGHKTPAIAHKKLAAGAIGITSALVDIAALYNQWTSFPAASTPSQQASRTCHRRSGGSASVYPVTPASTSSVQ